MTPSLGILLSIAVKFAVFVALEQLELRFPHLSGVKPPLGVMSSSKVNTTSSLAHCFLCWGAMHHRCLKIHCFATRERKSGALDPQVEGCKESEGLGIRMGCTHQHKSPTCKAQDTTRPRLKLPAICLAYAAC